MNHSLNEFLNYYWGYDSFSDTQSQAIAAVMDGKDTLLSMQTSGGKSLCYQVPAIAKPGTAIIVSPLISLMKDQVDDLQRRSIAAAYINSSQDIEQQSQVLNQLETGQLKLLYTSPERLLNKEFIQILSRVHVSFFAIDEAHCVSVWGHDFRRSYRNIITSLTHLEHAQGGRIQRFACTATATPAIRRDICSQLSMSSPVTISTSYDRPTIDLNVIDTTSKTKALRELVDLYQKEPILIYASTVKAVEQITLDLKGDGFDCAPYHGRMPTEEKNRIQEAFINNSLNIVVATNSFGMGVNKKNLRTVIHYHLPPSIENYYQEVGRASRDGLPSKAFMLYSERDRNLHTFLNDLSNPPEDHVRDILSISQTLSGGEVVTLTTREISSIATLDVKNKHIPIIFSYLADHGFVELFQSADDDNVIVFSTTPKNICELDVSPLQQSRNMFNKRLSNIEGFAKTAQCKRNYILQHFGEYAHESGCGRCNSCVDLKQTLSKTRLNPDISKSIFRLVEHLGQRSNQQLISSILIGSSNERIIRRGYDKHASYSILSNWKKPDISLLINHLLDQNYLVLKKGVGVSIVATTDKLKTSLRNNDEIDLPQSLSNIQLGIVKKTESAEFSFKGQVKNNLLSLRKQLSKDLEKPEFMILSDKTINSLSEADNVSLDNLKDHYISDARIKLFGGRIIEVIQSDVRNDNKLTFDH